MSASVLSIYLIGYKIPADRLRKQTSVRGCMDKATASNFCGVCGARTWIVREERMLHDSDEIGEFTVRTAEWGEREVAYIGIELNKFTSAEVLIQLVQDLEQRRERLHAELDQRGIRYDDCSFGLHLVSEIC